MPREVFESWIPTARSVHRALVKPRALSHSVSYSQPIFIFISNENEFALKREAFEPRASHRVFAALEKTKLQPQNASAQRGEFNTTYPQLVEILF